MASTRWVLVTGSNKGIGLAIVKAILQHDPCYSVLMGVRDLTRGQRALEEVLAEGSDRAGRAELLMLDVGDAVSVQRAAETVAAKFGRTPPPLFGIVNNAGIYNPDLARSLDVNLFGPQRVCTAFLPLLQPDGGRIVNVASASGPMFVEKCSPEWQAFFTDPSVTWERIEAVAAEALTLFSEGTAALAAKGLWDGMYGVYGLSKALLNSYTVFLSRGHPLLHINSCTPGFIETDLTRPMAESQGKTPQEVGMKPPEDGARCPVLLLISPPEGSGRYYGSDAVRSPLDRYRAPGAPAYEGP
eukprot:GGOE01028622.1.p1 GENE.GGOE01028622.1~~GGOE01028622.1.p1  ORF type:complete len:316 (-),score=97.74 GGOE01028622.1:397-1296(-)